MAASPRFATPSSAEPALVLADIACYVLGPGHTQANPLRPPQQQSISFEFRQTIAQCFFGKALGFLSVPTGEARTVIHALLDGALTFDAARLELDNLRAHLPAGLLPVSIDAAQALIEGWKQMRATP